MRGFRFISALITVAFALQPMSAGAQTLMRPDKSTTVTSTTPLLIVGSYGVGGLVRAIYPSSDPTIVYENEILLQRNGMVWDQYLLGSLVCEWLVSKFGADKLVSWTKLLMATKGQNRDTESAANAVAFKSTFGFEYADLATWITPYLAARSAQLRAAWFAQTKNQINQQTLFSTQQVPDFTVQQTSLNDDQKDWITRRVKDGPIRLVVCTANYSSKSSKSDIKKYQLRAKNSCDFAKSMVGGFGVPPIVSTKLVKKANSTLDGAVFLTF